MRERWRPCSDLAMASHEVESEDRLVSVLVSGVERHHVPFAGSMSWVDRPVRTFWSQKSFSSSSKILLNPPIIITNFPTVHGRLLAKRAYFIFTFVLSPPSLLPCPDTS